MNKKPLTVYINRDTTALSDTVPEPGYFGIFISMTKQAAEDYVEYNGKDDLSAEEEGFLRSAKNYLFKDKNAVSLKHLTEICGLDIDVLSVVSGRKITTMRGDKKWSRTKGYTSE